jgi:hypothetical protein
MNYYGLRAVVLAEELKKICLNKNSRRSPAQFIDFHKLNLLSPVKFIIPSARWRNETLLLSRDFARIT